MYKLLVAPFEVFEISTCPVPRTVRVRFTAGLWRLAQSPRTSSLGSALEEIWKPAVGGSENPLLHPLGGCSLRAARQDLSDHSGESLIHLDATLQSQEGAS